MTLPNVLTVFRILLTIVFIVLMPQHGLMPKLAAALVFIIASFTDYFDGYYAKKFNLITDFGKLMDPIADKFLILAAFFIFMQMHLIAAWMFVIIFLREVLITGLRLFAMGKGEVLAAEKTGKYKTVAQMIAIFFILIFIIFTETHFFETWPKMVMQGWLSGILILMLIAVGLTLVSGILYVWDNRRLMHV